MYEVLRFMDTGLGSGITQIKKISKSRKSFPAADKKFNCLEKKNLS